MRNFCRLLPWVLIGAAWGQQDETVTDMLDDTQVSDTQPASDPGVASETPPQKQAVPERDVSLNPIKFAPNFFSDQKKIWTFPLKVATGHHLIPVLAILGATAGIVAGVDPPAARYFQRHASTYQGFNNFLSENVTTSGTLLIPTALMLGGYIGKDKYLAHTGLLALEAWVDIDILDIAIRSTMRRRRPLDIPANGSLRDTWFKTSGNPMTSSGSFPSGHTGWAFAVATVVARRYPQHKWIAALSYGLACVDMISRVTSSNHFVSDSVFGAALGYATGRFVVLRQ
jgi:membrane-associated phospholipid phosphatase